MITTDNSTSHNDLATIIQWSMNMTTFCASLQERLVRLERREFFSWTVEKVPALPTPTGNYPDGKL